MLTIYNIFYGFLEERVVHLEMAYHVTTQQAQMFPELELTRRTNDKFLLVLDRFLVARQVLCVIFDLLPVVFSVEYRFEEAAIVFDQWLLQDACDRLKRQRNYFV